MLGGEGANDVAFLLPSSPFQWNAIDDVGVTHPIICRIPALTKSRRAENEMALRIIKSQEVGAGQHWMPYPGTRQLGVKERNQVMYYCP